MNALQVMDNYCKEEWYKSDLKEEREEGLLKREGV